MIVSYSSATHSPVCHPKLEQVTDGIDNYRVPSGFKNEMVLSTTYGDGKGGATMCGKPATFS